ncbi:MAG: LD-carboxypeptidase [Bacteroidetes bacterium]|nr:LD-carboxypeptidase [Bacteroidota bacterium]
MDILKPVRLKKGDVIGVVAPASRVTAEEKVHKGVEYLEKLGYRVELGKHVFDLHGYCAGRDEDRAADFNAMVLNPSIKAIFTIRGGYGTPRILHLIDYRALRRNPKVIVGYSDISALQLAIFKKAGLVTFSGPMIGVEMWNDMDPLTEEHFWRLITSSKKIGVLQVDSSTPLDVVKRGYTQGTLVPTNLSLMLSLLGTQYFPVLKKSILVVEDVDEEPHRIDRMFAQLFHANVLRELAGLIFGTFVACEADDDEPHFTLEQVLREYAQYIKGPVLARFPYGHIPRKVTLPIGLRATINTSKRRVVIDESAVL